MPDKTWKAVERKLATMFGATRNLLQSRGSETCDFYMPEHFPVLGGCEAEVKHRKTLPAWIQEARDKGRVVFLHQKQMPFAETLAIISVADLLALLEHAALAAPEEAKTTLKGWQRDGIGYTTTVEEGGR